MRASFSALQRAEIAEMGCVVRLMRTQTCFSALQRAEIAEIKRFCGLLENVGRFSALQRAEIAEIAVRESVVVRAVPVSVLFNEPKLLKSCGVSDAGDQYCAFQCSSTSRNC